jgi:hypothetical protein
MFPILDLNNPVNWELAYNEARIAQKIDVGIIKIIPFELSLTASILAIRCINEVAPNNWFHAGNLTQSFAIGINNSVADYNFRLNLNRINLITLFQLAEYSLVFTPAKWHTRMQLSIWKFTGQIAINSEMELITALDDNFLSL